MLKDTLKLLTALALLSVHSPATSQVTNFLVPYKGPDGVKQQTLAPPGSTGRYLTSNPAGTLSWETVDTSALLSTANTWTQANAFPIVTIGDGTNATPTLSFTSAPTTGIHKSWSNGLGFGVGGTFIANIDSTGLTLAKKALKFEGITSGSITFNPPSVAGTQSYTLPTAVPTGSGQYLTSTTGGVMSWATVDTSALLSTANTWTQTNTFNKASTTGSIVVSPVWNDSGSRHVGIRLQPTITSSVENSPLLASYGADGTTVQAGIFDAGVVGVKKLSFMRDDRPWITTDGYLLGLADSSIAVAVGGGPTMAFRRDYGFFLHRDSGLHWGDEFNNASSGPATLSLVRPAAAVLQLGVNHATTPTAQTIKAHDVTTGTGADLILKGGTGSVADGGITLDGAVVGRSFYLAGSGSSGIATGGNGRLLFNVYNNPMGYFSAGQVGFLLRGDVGFGWDTGDNNGITYTPSVAIWRGGDNILSQRNGLNPQRFELANWVSGNSNEMGFMSWKEPGYSNELIIGTSHSGGVQRNVRMLQDLNFTTSGTNSFVNGQGLTAGIGSFGQVSLYYSYGRGVVLSSDGGLNLASDNFVKWGPSAKIDDIGSVRDLIIGRDAAATVQLGEDHATTATAQTIKAHDVTTGPGANLVLKGGTGSTGNGIVDLVGEVHITPPKHEMDLDSSTLSIERYRHSPHGVRGRLTEGAYAANLFSYSYGRLGLGDGALSPTNSKMEFRGTILFIDTINHIWFGENDSGNNNLIKFHHDTSAGDNDTYYFYTARVANDTDRPNLFLGGKNISFSTGPNGNTAHNNPVAMTIASGGNVGIGTDTPTSKLHVVGSAIISGDSDFATTAGYQANFGQYPAMLGGSGTSYSGLGYNVDFQTDNSYDYKSNDSAYFIQLGGETGSEIAFKVAPAGTAGNPISFTNKLRLSATGSHILGSGGIGESLRIYGNQHGYTGLGSSRVLILQDVNGSVGNRQEIGMGYYNGISSYQPVVIGAVGTSVSDYTKSDFYIATRDETTDTAPTERLRIKSDGRVSIGTTPADYTGLTVYHPPMDNINTTGIRAVVSGGANTTNYAAYLSATEGSRPYGLYVANGWSYFGGPVQMNNNPLLDAGNSMIGNLPNDYGNLRVAENDNGSFAAGIGGKITFWGATAGQSEKERAVFAGVYGVKENSGYLNNLGALVFLTNPVVALDNSTRTSADLVERMRITSDGKIGIGISSPVSKLHVVGTTDAGGSMTIGDSTLLDYPIGADALRVVTPNTTSPALTLQGRTGQLSAILDVRKPGQSMLAVYETGGSMNGAWMMGGGASLSISTGGTGSDLLQLGNVGGGRTYYLGSVNDGSFRIRDHTGSADRLTIASDGKVGIATASPTSTLTVNGDSLLGGMKVHEASTTTQNHIQVSNQHSGQTNSSVVISPKGTGAFIVGPPPDGTAVGGNARGDNSIDIQPDRLQATDVASGDRSVTIGTQNEASNNGSVAIGQGNDNRANNMIVLGQYNYTADVSSSSGNFVAGTYHYVHPGSGQGLSITGYGHTIQGLSEARALAMTGYSGVARRMGDIQHAVYQWSYQVPVQSGTTTLYIATADDTQTELSLDGASSMKRLGLTAGQTYDCSIRITGRKSDGTASASYWRRALIQRTGTTTALVSTVQTIGTDIEDDAAWDVSVTADDTNEALAIKVTGVASTDIRWIAIVEWTELNY